VSRVIYRKAFLFDRGVQGDKAISEKVSEGARKEAASA
jgi:hypothetical protein